MSNRFYKYSCTLPASHDVEVSMKNGKPVYGLVSYQIIQLVLEDFYKNDLTLMTKIKEIIAKSSAMGYWNKQPIKVVHEYAKLLDSSMAMTEFCSKNKLSTADGFNYRYAAAQSVLTAFTIGMYRPEATAKLLAQHICKILKETNPTPNELYQQAAKEWFEFDQYSDTISNEMAASILLSSSDTEVFDKILSKVPIFVFLVGIGEIDHFFKEQQKEKEAVVSALNAPREEVKIKEPEPLPIAPTPVEPPIEKEQPIPKKKKKPAKQPEVIDLPEPEPTPPKTQEESEVIISTALVPYQKGFLLGDADPIIAVLGKMIIEDENQSICRAIINHYYASDFSNEFKFPSKLLNLQYELYNNYTFNQVLQIKDNEDKSCAYFAENPAKNVVIAAEQIFKRLKADLGSKVDLYESAQKYYDMVSHKSYNPCQAFYMTYYYGGSVITLSRLENLYLYLRQAIILGKQKK